MSIQDKLEMFSFLLRPSRSYISEGSSIMPSFPFSGPDIKLEVGVEYEKGTIT